MFFTPELLQRRDSGFGLIWLAATLGSKSALRKLPRKGILSADIPQLCQMITSPSEPLALRLSANLMVGVIRVYHARNEIWATDVTHTFTSLKKAVTAMYAEAGAATLEMAQGTVRADMISLPVAGERMSVGLGFDFDFNFNFGAMDKNWEEYGVVTPAVARTRTADLRAITLNESHLLPIGQPLDAQDFDFSFDSVPGAVGGPSSSSAAPRSSRTGHHATSSSGNEPFNLDFDLDLGLGDGVVGPDGRIDLGLGMDEEDGWGAQAGWGDANAGDGMQMDLDMIMNMDVEPVGADGLPGTPSDNLSSAVRRDMAAGHRRKPRDLGLDAAEPLPAHQRTPSLTHSQESPPSGMDLDELPPSGSKRPGEELEAENKKKKKRVRLWLDIRTELTDEELQANRQGYVGNMLKAWEENQGKTAKPWVTALLEKNIPDGYEAPELRDCFAEVFENNLEARKRRWAEVTPDAEGAVRRRLSPEVGRGRGLLVYPDDDILPGGDPQADAEWGQGQDWGDQQMAELNEGDIQARRTPKSILRPSLPSSVEQARGASLPPDFTQKSNSFPWDNVDIDGHPSSSSWAPFSVGGRSSDGPRSGLSPSVEVNPTETRIRHGSREGSLVPSDMGSTPKRSIGGAEGPIEDFPGFPEASLQGQSLSQSQSQSQDPETLERNSRNFLEFIKAEHNVAQRGLPAGAGPATITLDSVLPAYAKTRHVAANAFYNCLGLATKNHLKLLQPVPFGDISIQIL